MEKYFTQWNTNKQDIHASGMRKFYHVREVWWCALGVNIGSEQDGSGDEYRRPVLILKGLSKDTCLIIPLTTSKQTHFLRPAIGMIGGKEAHALISQLRVIDTRRLVRKIEYLQIEKFEIIRKIARDML